MTSLSWSTATRTGLTSYTWELTRLLTALKQAFCRSGVPDVIWSDQGPQFTSKLFQDFSAKWGFRHITTYPQSNGKAKATVSMKKLIQASWTDSHLNEGKLARALLQYRNTPSRKDGRRSFSGIQSRTYSLLTTEPSHQNGSGAQRRLTLRPLPIRNRWRSTTTGMQSLSPRSTLAPASLFRTLSPSSGTPMVQ